MTNEVSRNTAGTITGSVLSYAVFILWTLITIVPLVWMLYSSFKSNERNNFV